METKQCHMCKETKPVSEFYTLSSGALQNRCKKCHGIVNSQYPPRPKTDTGNEHEQAVISLLLSNGIYATNGKSSAFKWVDVVAWGCVRIEVKSSAEIATGYYHFSFSPGQQRKGFKSDLVIIYTQGDYPISIFPASHPVFYKPSGKLKSAVSWKPRMRHTKSPVGTVVLNDTLMRNYQERWDLIEDVRQQKILEMLEDGSIATERSQVRSPQLALGI